jgi:adenine-specific DNA-methyltransferase
MGHLEWQAAIQKKRLGCAPCPEPFDSPGLGLTWTKGGCCKLKGINVPELVFKGKEFVYNHHLSIPYHSLVPDPEKSIGAGALDGNLIIHGDNLKALKALLPHYAGKVDCIFIDPPYNTGTESWSYNDNVNSPIMREWFDTNPISKDDLLRHDKWLCMMYPRIKLLHELLSESGTFWMTIDDNEVHHARALLDDIFGPDRFFACVVWQKRTSPEARVRLGAAHDYILVYGKGKPKESLSKLTVVDEEGDAADPDDDPWTSTDLTAQGYRKNQMYKIITPTGAEYEPPPGRCWSMLEPEFLKLKAEGRIWFGVNGDARPRIKNYLSESDGISAWTWWTNKEVGDNQ